MDDTDYDECSRQMARRARGPMMHWLLDLDSSHICFDSWKDPVLNWPGVKASGRK